MFGVKSIGSFSKLIRDLTRMASQEPYSDFASLAKLGVDALASSTPRDSGATAESWSYSIVEEGGKVSIEWFNSSSIRTGTPIVILLQYGHGTGTGGYVQGYDFINPAMRPIFDRIAADVWEKIKS